jgi:Na+/proline symporter
MFITTAEALLNWGGSFLTLDLYQKYRKPNASSQQIRRFSFIAMVALSLCATFFAIQINNLESLIKITFSIAAGVAPVYILRWVWYRINAWSQLSAMISSGLFTTLYPTFHNKLPFAEWPMTESRILVVTLLTTIVWLLVTYLTPNQHNEVKQRMNTLHSELNLPTFVKRFALAISLGLTSLILVALLWFFLLKSN